MLGMLATNVLDAGVVDDKEKRDRSRLLSKALSKIARDNHWVKSISVEAHKRGLDRTTILIIMREVMTSYSSLGYGSMTLLPSMLWAECQLHCSVDDCDRDCLESRV